MNADSSRYTDALIRHTVHNNGIATAVDVGHTEQKEARILVRQSV